MSFSLVLAATFFVFLASSAQAGPNADVDIALTRLSPPCGLEAGQRIEFRIAGRNLDGVRQIKFDFHWAPAGAISSGVGGTATATEEKGFIAPGPPQIWGDIATYGMAVFGGSGLSGEGELALVGFEVASHITPSDLVALYIDAISLGPSSTERDTIYPQEAAVLANYCDATGQPLANALFLQASHPARLYSSAERATLADSSNGEIDLFAQPLVEPTFRADTEINWQLVNPGPGTLYAHLPERSIAIAPGESSQIQTRSNYLGQAHLRVDAAGGPGDTEARALACADLSGQSLCAEQLLIWQSPITAVISEEAGALPSASHLWANYPNPFNASTVLAFDISASDAGSYTQLAIYNSLGQQIAVPFAGRPAAGTHRVHWDGRHLNGAPSASGLYISRLLTDSGAQSRRLMLLR